MIPKLLRYSLFTSLILTSACKKENHTNNPPDYLLKTITSDNGVTVNLSYHPDSTLKNIDFSYQGFTGKTVFSWSGKTLTEFYEDRSMYKNLFEYDQQGRVATMRHINKTGSATSGYLLEFQYNAHNQVDSLKLFLVNIAGKYLQASTSYHYNNSGELKEAITKSANSTFTYTIDMYSPPVSYNPSVYIESSIGENYTIYNYAVMSQLSRTNKLPAKISRVTKHGSQPANVDKIEEQAYTVTNHRIDKVSINIHFPLTPGNNASIESVYSYF